MNVDDDGERKREREGDGGGSISMLRCQYMAPSMGTFNIFQDL
jgi:hypothetical protein